MKQYDAKKILNIALAGHSGCGKTSVAESILYLAKVSDRLGKIADGNTMLDFDSEEIKRQASIMTAVAPIEWKNTKINLIDTPGLFDFAGGVAEGMRAADTALIVVSGKDGISVGTGSLSTVCATRTRVSIAYLKHSRRPSVPLSAPLLFPTFRTVRLTPTSTSLITRLTSTTPRAT